MTLNTNQTVETSQTDSVFDATTMLVPDRANAGRFTAQLDPLWASLVGVHGGYLAAVAIKAAEIVVGVDRPIRTATTSYLRPGEIGQADVGVEVVRQGRAISNLTVTLSQRSRAIVICHVTAASAVASSSWETIRELDLPPIERCIPIQPPPGIGHFDHGVAMLDPTDLPFAHGPRARVAGYMQPIEPRAIDAPWLGMALDWFPPSSFSRVDPPVGGISISYTIHIHRTLDHLAEGEWLGGVFHADISSEGIALEKGLITDPDGRILAESFHTRWTADPRS
ncbi:MAG: thioesterase family protein [Ilumatobacteraceae bacterium]